jgi:lipoyl(octanoyl) transferase
MDTAASLSVARLGLVDYTAALELQNAMVAARIRDAIGDTLLLLVPIHRVSRGGQVTYHGPGQIIGYPIIKLAGARRDVSRYLRKLEQALIAALLEYDIVAARGDGMTGVWAAARKIASIGVGIRRWVTMHGFALNVTTDLSYFDAIVPCGIEGCRMTSIAALGQPQVTVAAFADTLERAFAAAFEYDRIVAAEPRRLWALLESTADRCEA